MYDEGRMTVASLEASLEARRRLSCNPDNNSFPDCCHGACFFLFDELSGRVTKFPLISEYHGEKAK